MTSPVKRILGLLVIGTTFLCLRAMASQNAQWEQGRSMTWFCVRKCHICSGWLGDSWVCEGIGGSWASWIKKDGQIKTWNDSVSFGRSASDLENVSLRLYGSYSFSDMQTLENPVSLVYVIALGLVINLSAWIRTYFLHTTDLLLKGLSTYMQEKPKCSVRWMMLWKYVVYIYYLIIWAVLPSIFKVCGCVFPCPAQNRLSN